MTVRLSHKKGDFIDTEKNQFQIIEQIKSGGMGTVYKILKLSTNNVYAVKECDLLDDPRNKQISRSEAIKIFRREGKHMEALKCPAVPQSFMFTVNQNDLKICLKCGNPVSNNTCDICQLQSNSLYYNPQHIKKRYYLFMDYIEGKDLDEMINIWTYPIETDKAKKILTWMMRIGEAIHLIHENNLIYRDLKPNNIRFCTTDKQVYLIDFGLVRPEQYSKSVYFQKQLTSKLGTDGYAPPEQVEGKPCKQSDIYAITMTTIELLTGLHPGDQEDREKIIKGYYKDFIQFISLDALKILHLSLSIDPLKRPSAKQWLQSIENAFSTVKKTKVLFQPLSAKQTKIISTQIFKKTKFVKPKIKQYKVSFFIAISVFILLALIYLNFSSSKFYFNAIGRSETTIYSDSKQSKVIRKLKGGEQLVVEQLEGMDKYMLKIISIDNEKTKGYILRNQVDVYDRIQ